MRLLLTALVALSVGAFGAGTKTKTINGVKVIPKGTFAAAPAVEVYGLKFYEAFAPEKGTGVTVITGTLVSRYPRRDLVFHVDITMYVIPPNVNNEVGGNGVCRATVTRPEPNKPTKFAVVTDYWWGKDYERKKPGWTPRYQFTVHVERWSPPKVDPVPDKLGEAERKP